MNLTLILTACLLTDPQSDAKAALALAEANKKQTTSLYMQAANQALREKKAFAVWVRSDKPEGIIDLENYPNTICVSLQKFPECNWQTKVVDGDFVLSSYQGDWFRVDQFFSTKPKKPTVKQSLSVDDCPTGR